MDLLFSHPLSLLLLLPLLGAGAVLFLPKERPDLHCVVAVAFSLLSLALSLFLLQQFQPIATYQFVEQKALVKTFGITYHLGLDGISLLLTLLTTALMPITLLASKRAVTKNSRSYYALFMLLYTGMLGTLFALDTLLFYLFWELMLVPMFFIIGIWGGPRRIYASVKFVLFTVLGSLPMLLAIMFLHAWASREGTPTFALQAFLKLNLSVTTQCWLFAAFALAFAIKVPLFPLHTWLPDAHVEAPTGGSVILAGVLLKMGGYGFLRFALPLFPDAARLFAPYMITLALIGIVYGALLSLVQTDMKKLVAYSSVSHMGYIILGLFTFTQQGIQGGIYQMLNHGISTSALFLLVGILYERRHTRDFDEYGGLMRIMPWMAVALCITAFSSAGVPGLNGFIGEFLILVSSSTLSIFVTAVAGLGVVLGAAYLLLLLQKVLFGPVTREQNKSLPDLSWREVAVLIPLVVSMFFMGLFPDPILKKMEPSVRTLLEQMEVRK